MSRYLIGSDRSTCKHCGAVTYRALICGLVRWRHLHAAESVACDARRAAGRSLQALRHVLDERAADDALRADTELAGYL